jgi:hypothetical protein
VVSLTPRRCSPGHSQCQGVEVAPRSVRRASPSSTRRSASPTSAARYDPSCPYARPPAVWAYPLTHKRWREGDSSDCDPRSALLAPQECRRECPVVRQGKACIEVTPTSKVGSFLFPTATRFGLVQTLWPLPSIACRLPVAPLEDLQHLTPVGFALACHRLPSSRRRCATAVISAPSGAPSAPFGSSTWPPRPPRGRRPTATGATPSSSTGVVFLAASDVKRLYTPPSHWVSYWRDDG